MVLVLVPMLVCDVVIVLVSVLVMVFALVLWMSLDFSGM
jgi:hypothetical protein